MSRAEVATSPRMRRPPREEVRRRLLDAGASVFAERGLEGASVEEIAETAGFSRGALYSNFQDKYELFLALANREDRRIVGEIAALAAEQSSPAGFFDALRRRGVRQKPEARQWGILSMELWLYAMRTPEVRTLLAERQATLRTMFGAAIEAEFGSRGWSVPLPADQVGAVVLALDEGLMLQEQLDPDALPPSFFIDVLAALSQSMIRPPDQPIDPSPASESAG